MHGLVKLLLPLKEHFQPQPVSFLETTIFPLLPVPFDFEHRHDFHSAEGAERHHHGQDGQLCAMVFLLANRTAEKDKPQPIHPRSWIFIKREYYNKENVARISVTAIRH